jgi:hypothetical protein
MAGVLYQQFKHGEEVTRSTLYRLLFNSGFVGLALLAILAVIGLLLFTQNAS